MFILATVTKWSSIRDGGGRVTSIDKPQGRVFLLNPQRIEHLRPRGLGTKFLWHDNPQDPREGGSYVETNVSLQEIENAINAPNSSSFVTLPVYIDNKISEGTINTGIPVDNISFVDECNYDDNAAWVVYLEDGHKKKKVLCGYSMWTIASYIQYGYYSLFDLFSYLWTGDVVGNNLISEKADRRVITVTGKDFMGSYIPDTSTAIFKLQADADFKVDDCTDYLWFDIDGNQRATNVTELISDNYRTVVKYNNESPFNIYAIGLLDDSVILAQSVIDNLSHDFWLWLFWSGVFNDYGYLKDNRMIGIGMSISVGTGSLAPLPPLDAPTLLTATPYSATRIDLAWINPISAFSSNKIYISTDNITFTLKDTISPDTSYSATVLIAATHYYFKVVTATGSRVSVDSNTVDTDTMLALPTGLTLTLISGGVQIDWADASGGVDQTEIWAQSNGGVSALLTTKNAGVITHNDILAPVDLRYYKIRAKNGTAYSNFTTELSIAMLASDIILYGNFSNPTEWGLPGATWSIGSGIANFLDTGEGMMTKVDAISITAGEVYLISFDVSNCVAGGRLVFTTTSGGIFLDAPYNAGMTIANGHYDLTVTVNAGTNNTFACYAYAAGESFSIDNLTMKKILVP